MIRSSVYAKPTARRSWRESTLTGPRSVSADRVVSQVT